MQQQLITMLELQEAMNVKVHPHWRQQEFAWHRAIWLESAELLEHYGWKWWKKQTPDHAQVALELVDIWHFGLSMALQKGDNHKLIAAAFEQGLCTPVGPTDFMSATETFVGTVLKREGFPVAEFAQLMQLSHLSFLRLYSLYVGKNILNFFRQDHGYKEGTYQKIWHGKEDNEYLIEILEKVDSAAPNYKELLYSALADAYAKAQAPI